MWQLNFAHWDLEKALRVYNRESFELDYSWNRLVKEKHDPEDIIAQDSCIQHCKVDHLVVDINWFEISVLNVFVNGTSPGANVVVTPFSSVVEPLSNCGS